MTIAGRLAVLLLALTAISEPNRGDVATHATRGVVKTAAATTIVVTRAKNLGNITIVLSASTHIEGHIRVGSTVSVRYRDQHGHHLATAVSVEH